MVQRRELVTICRQIGTMMEVGVDFLRITWALRQQTENPRLLELYDQLDHDMKMGEGLAEALSHAPDVFSPFAVSLIRQGEKRGDIEGAWHRLADFLKQEAQEDQELDVPEPIGAGYIPTRGYRSNGLEIISARSPITVGLVSDLIDRLQVVILRSLTWVSGFLLSLSAVWWCGELGILKRRWVVGVLYCVAAIFIGGAGSWIRTRLENDRQRKKLCSFCGKDEGVGLVLTRSSHLAGAAICQNCAGMIASATSGPISGDDNSDTSGDPFSIDPGQHGPLSTPRPPSPGPLDEGAVFEL